MSPEDMAHLLGLLIANAKSEDDLLDLIGTFGAALNMVLNRVAPRNGGEKLIENTMTFLHRQTIRDYRLREYEQLVRHEGTRH